MTHVLYCLWNSNQAGEQDIQLTNDKIVVGQYSDPKKAQQGKPVNQGRKQSDPQCAAGKGFWWEWKQPILIYLLM